MQFANNKERIAFLLGLGIAVAIILFAVIAKYGSDAIPLNSHYENTLEKKRLLDQMRIQLLKSVEREKNAVMALSDRESLEFADQSRLASATVASNLSRLRALVDAIASPDEKKLLDEFTTCWTEFGQLDQIILELAVENTNLKAAALSKEKGAEAMQRFEQALERLLPLSSGTGSEGRVEELVFRALVAGLKLYNLHSVHIAEPTDENMDRIEARMRGEENRVAEAFATLSDLVVDGEGREVVSQAKTAFAEFTAVTAKVMELSRKNSNVQSQALSFGKKRTIAAQCDAVLATFQDTVHNKSYKATK